MRKPGVFLLGCSLVSLVGCGGADGSDGCPDGSCSQCGAGNYQNASGCVALTDCPPGSYVAQPPTTVTDRVCLPCPSGTFSESGNALSCASWSVCAAGSFVTAAPSASSNRICAPCPPGTLTTAPNQPVCVAPVECAAGTQRTGVSDCAACTAGQYCAGGAAVGVACAAEAWDHDADPATACAPQTPCAPGTYVVSPGSAIADRGCLPCPDGTFSVTANAVACQAWSTCTPGSFVTSSPSASSDRTCSPCPTGTYATRPNTATCSPPPKCAAGTVLTTATVDTAPACRTCQPGEYCAGEAAPAVTCPADTWDKDMSPATPCAPKSTCPAGTTVAQAGTLTTDRTCTACPPGAFNELPNATACAPWTVCPAGTHVTNASLISSTVDRLCANCPTGTYSTSANVSTCNTIGTCAAGTYKVLPVPSDAPPCGVCVAGQYCAGGEAPATDCATGTFDHDGDPATACISWTPCLAGTYVSTPGSATNNQACSLCPAGAYTDRANQPRCEGCTRLSETFSNPAPGWTLDEGWQIGSAAAPWNPDPVNVDGFPDPSTDHSGSGDQAIAGVVIGGTVPREVGAAKYLTSPVVDLSTADSSATLQFWRWLNSDWQGWTDNTVEVWDATTQAWAVLWINPLEMTVTDGSWQPMSFPLVGTGFDYRSDGFRFRFGYRVVSADLNMSGWNLDDVKIAVSGAGCGG